MKKVLAFYILIVATVITINAQTEKVEIIFISNSGFLLYSGNEKFLIDGIYSVGSGIFTVPSDDILNKERNAITPFDSVNMLLVSHYHSDHINPDYVIDHMINDGPSVLVSTTQVKSLLENNPNFDLVKDNINSIVPPSGTKIDTTIKDVRLKIMSLRHNNDSKNEHQNLGFIIKTNQFRIFHPGDAQADNPDEYKNLKLADDSIDIAFIPYWFFDNDKKGKEIIDYLKPKAIIIIHIRINQSDSYRKKVNSMTGIPPVYFMDTSMQKISFNKSDEELSVLTSVESKNNLQLSFYLSQNYPNPFNPTTKINYTVPSVGISLMKFLQIKVYDILGNEVATLVNEEKPAGNYEVEFSAGSCGDGSRLSSGIYFYQIKTEFFVKTGKMVLMK
jgi:L-ascorbate metabolism protein UlaG (beta-lactamase superfamily)